VILAVYDRASSELTYAKAGHAPPIVLGAAHDPDAEPAACPIGLGLGRDWPELRLRLSDNVAVCLYTDGLEDAQAEGARLGRDTVAQLLAAQAEPNATQLLDDVRALAFRVADDNAAVVLSLEPATELHGALPGPTPPGVAAASSR